MSNCQQFDDLMSDYVEGNIPFNSKRDIEYHLQNCQICSTKAKKINILRETLKKLPALSVSPNFETILRTRISFENRQRRHRIENLFSPWQVRIPLYGISFALIIIAILAIFSQISNKSSYLPEAAENPQWKNGQFIQQNVSSGRVTVYSLDREPAINVIANSPVKHLNSGVSSMQTQTDTLNQLAENKKLKKDVYQTSY